MGVLRCDHPDVLDFVRAKSTPGALATFNLSVGVTDAFMHAVQARTSFALVHPRTGAAVHELPAHELFDTIAQAAWQTGDPGLLFLDAIERANPTPARGPIEATNPCGEVPLLPYESCTLGSLNLARMLRHGESGYQLDEPRLRSTTRLAVRFLDNVIEVGRFPVPAIGEQTRRTRKIGLGVMGLAELLIRLGLPYGSEASQRLATRVMALIALEARFASETLAQERGGFPDFLQSTHAGGKPLRNATRTAIAPTGTISILADTTAGIEPLFALAYHRKHGLDGAPFQQVNRLFLEAAARLGTDGARLIAEVERHGRLSLVPDAPDSLKRLFTTAAEVPAEAQLRIQAAFQRQVDNSVSKTIQLAPDAAPNDVACIYRRAFELGLKGITVFRQGSRPSQVIELGLGQEPYRDEHGAKCDPEECKV
jgi:ribonucleoside-diphosphate reductase alpha chain